MDARAAARKVRRWRLAQEEPKPALPESFPVQLGVLAILNFMKDVRHANAGVDTNAIKQEMIGDLAEYNLRDPALLDIITQGGTNPDRVRVPDFDAFFETLVGAETFDEPAVRAAHAQAKMFGPEPQGGATGGQPPWDDLWTSIGQGFGAKVQEKQIEARRARVPGLPAIPTVGSAERRTKTAQGGPLSVGRYESLSQLREDLLSMGPSPDTFERVMGYVGDDDEDSAKDALTEFFRGSPTALAFLYDMLVQVGMASPVDSEIVGELMSRHPEVSQEDGERPTEPANAHFAGLFLPDADSGLMTKIASGYVGGPSPAVYTHGPGENRMCPKIRNVVNTYTCRYHCLDGLAIDDHQILCGEAIWRQSVMDKFSREYRDEDGNWVGGYINKRFEVHHDTGGHPYQLKPGQRHAPIHEDAWSTEKRLQEMRRNEGDARGYCKTPGDPEGLYNFDQHDLAKGPETPNLSEKPMDKIASRDVRVADSMYDDLARLDPREAYPASEEPLAPEANDIITPDYENWYQNEQLYFQGAPAALAQKLNQDKFWPHIWHAPQGGKPQFITHRVQGEKGASVYNRKAIREAANFGDPMMDNVNVGKVGMQCPSCRKKFSGEAKACDMCGTKLVALNMRDMQAETNFIKAPPKGAFAMSYSNGVFRASQNGDHAYGSSPGEATRRLEARHVNAETLEDEAEELLKLRQEQEGRQAPPVGQPQPPTGAPVDRTVTTDEVPIDDVPPVPDEVQGGETEFSIDASVLDQELEEAALTPEEQAEIEEQADALALGPDVKEE